MKENNQPIRLFEAAKRMGVSLKSVQRLVQAGKLVAFQIGRLWFTTQASIDAYIHAQIKRSQGKYASC